MVVRPRSGEADSDEMATMRSLAGGWAQLGRAWEEMTESWLAATAWTRAPQAVDVEALSRRLRALPGGEGVTVRLLDSGIVEVTGDAAAEEHARVFLDAVAEEAGVKVVLNRIWLRDTPEHQGRPAAADAPRVDRADPDADVAGPSPAAGEEGGGATPGGAAGPPHQGESPD